MSFADIVVDCLDCPIFTVSRDITMFDWSGAIVSSRRAWLGLERATAKRYDGCHSSKADVRRSTREPERDRCDRMDRRYVHNAGRQPDRAWQNYEPRPPVRQSPLQSSRTPLSSMEPWARGEWRSPLRDQDCLRARIHWWKPYVWIIWR